MKVIHSNEARTIGILSGVEGFIDLGAFNVADLENWLKMSKDAFGSEQVTIQFKLADDPRQPGYAIASSRGGEDPKVVVCGRYRADGRGMRWRKCGS